MPFYRKNKNPILDIAFLILAQPIPTRTQACKRFNKKTKTTNTKTYCYKWFNWCPLLACEYFIRRLPTIASQKGHKLVHSIGEEFVPCPGKCPAIVATLHQSALALLAPKEVESHDGNLRDLRLSHFLQGERTVDEWWSHDFTQGELNGF